MKKNSFMRIALMFIALSLSLSTYAAGESDIYTIGLKSLIKQGVVNGFNPNQLTQLASLTNGNTDQFVEEIAELCAPCYRQNMSEEEFGQMQAYYESAEMKELMLKFAANSVDAQQKVTQALMPNIMMMMQGQTPAPVDASSCSPEFKEEFDKYYDMTNADKVMEANMGAIGKMVDQMSLLSKGNKDKMKKNMETLMTYTKDNMKPLMMITVSNALTVDDLKAFNKVQEQPFYPAMKKANMAMAEEAGNIMANIMGKIKIPGM